MTAPLIGISTWRRTFDTELGDARPMHTLGAEYAAPVEAAGGAVVLLPPTAAVDTVLDRIDGLVISGGQDLDPSRYGAAPEAGKTYDPARDEYEIALVRGARERGIPVLAICRGMQVTNVAFGGSLIVDIDATTTHRPTTGAAQLDERHPVRIDVGSRLSRAYGVTERTVNTIHHQAVDRLAEGFRAVAWAPDGIVEAIEPDGDWAYWGVQWHPEKLAGAESAEETPLYAALIAAAQERAAGACAAKKGTA